MPSSDPGTSTSLFYPRSVTVDRSGNVFFADSENIVLRLDATTGVVTVVAGNAGAGFSGDNGAATGSELFFPAGVAVDATGNLYIADSYNSCVRKVSDGVITTVAGIGTDGGFSGDNGPATSARLYIPRGVAVDSAGDLYIADSENNRVRKVSNGVIITVAGSGTAGFSGDGGPATSAQLNVPVGLVIDFCQQPVHRGFW